MFDKNFNPKKFKHWQITQDDADIIWLYFNLADKSVNVITHDAMEEFAEIIQICEDNIATIKGVALLSGKETGFAYGADIPAFEKFTTPAETYKHLEFVQDNFARIAALSCPTAVGIDGFALGGGLELALPFDYIIASNHEKTQLAFPEVKLGLMPGYGGTGRSLARIGIFHMMRMVLTGRMVGVEEALEIGLINQIVADKTKLKDALAQAIHNGKHINPIAENGDIPAAIEDARIVIQAKYHEQQHPAPFKILEHLEKHAPNMQALITSELEVFSELLMGTISKNLRRVYDLTNRVKKQGKADANIRKLHVIGAGTMGGDIAAVAAMAGFEVSLQDLSEDAINNALMRAEKLFTRKLKTADKITEAKQRLVADATGLNVKNADMVIEAVAESLAVKQKVLGEIAKKVRSDTILASNTSAIPLEKIAQILPAPEQLIGIHFFNPVPVLPLVEIVKAKQSSDIFIKRALGFVGSLKKMPILCQSAPGFLVNRALFPYIFASIDLFLSGENSDKIDQALLNFGLPMGAIELADQIGLDICLDIGQSLGIPEQVKNNLQEKITRGDLGRKTGAGFYQWQDNKAMRARGTYDDAQMQSISQQLLAPLVAECERAVLEKVVENADMADAAMIFGIGFPDYTGGPLNWEKCKLAQNNS